MARPLFTFNNFVKHSSSFILSTLQISSFVLITKTILTCSFIYLFHLIIKFTGQLTPLPFIPKRKIVVIAMTLSQSMLKTLAGLANVVVELILLLSIVDSPLPQLEPCHDSKNLLLLILVELSQKLDEV